MPSASHASYSTSGTPIATISHHCDLGVHFSNDLTWSHHYSTIIAKGIQHYFLCRTMSPHHSVATKLTLYISLIQSRLSYSSQVWRPHYLKDIKSLERVQHRSTKFILNDYQSNHKSHLLTANLLPLSIWFELIYISFLINHFNKITSTFSLTLILIHLIKLKAFPH